MCSSVENYLLLDECICDASVRYINWERFKTGPPTDTPAIIIINRINVNDYVRPDNGVHFVKSAAVTVFTILLCLLDKTKHIKAVTKWT